MTAARRGSEIATRLQQLSAFDLGTSGPPTFSACGRRDIDPFQVARTLDLPHSFAIARYIPKWVQAKSTDWTHSQQEITEKD